MAWTAPPTFVSGAILTASQMNIISGDLNFLASPNGDQVNTFEAGTSTAYSGLTTPGPVISLTTGSSAIVAVSANLGNNTGGDIAIMSYQITGASNIAATDAVGIQSSDSEQMSFVAVRAGLTPGVNIFTAEYRVTGGSGTWGNRNITVFPLP